MTADPLRVWSLRRRLALQLSLLAIVAVLGPLIVMLVHARGQIETLSETVLQEQAAFVSRAVIGPGGEIRPLPPGLAEAYREGGAGYLFVVRDAEGRAVARSSPLAERLLGPDRRKAGKLFVVAPATGGSWLAYTRKVGDFEVMVAQDQRNEDVLADSVAWDLTQASLWVILPLLVAVLIVVHLTLTLMFRRVDAIADTAAALEPGEEATPLPLAGLPCEVTSLVSAVNLALSRLSQAYAAEKRFTADAAHELRTPLAILTARVEALKSSRDRQALQADVARINRVVEQLLQAARLDARPVDSDGVFDLGAVLLEAVADIAPLAVRQSREITLDVEGDRPIMVRGDPNAVGVVIANLIDNALRHTRSGPVEIVARASGEFSVQDRGDGVPEADKRLLFERFQRGSRPLGTGAGLGLAIVRQIVGQLGGAVSILDRDGGGAIFTVRLKPAAPKRRPAD